jgi:phosphatidylinositol-bisphosphatase
VRGVDDEGHVANFVETEQLVYHDNAYTSFVQVRGTLPVFWNQSSAGGRGNVTLSRGFECSQRAFEKHCARLIRRYGRQMFINLLGCRGSDQLLTEAYKDHYDKCPLKKDIELVSFDYHSYIASSMKLEKMKPLLYKKTENFLQSHGLFHCLRNEVLCMQSGVLRTNCMDCLDRTNVTQMFHAMEVSRYHDNNGEGCSIVDIAFLCRCCIISYVCWGSKRKLINDLWTPSGLVGRRMETISAGSMLAQEL